MTPRPLADLERVGSYGRTPLPLSDLPKHLASQRFILEKLEGPASTPKTHILLSHRLLQS